MAISPTRLHRYQRRKQLYFAALGVAVAVCLAQSFLILSPSEHLESDMRGYVERAIALHAGTPAMDFERFYPPGTSLAYAAVMLFFGPRQISLNIITALQALGLVWAMLMAGRTARIIWRLPNLEIATILLLSLFWPLAALGSFFLSEPLFCALYFTAQQLAVSAVLKGATSRKLFLSGFLYGLSALVRPQGVLGLVATVAILVWYRRAAKLRSLLLGVAIPIALLVTYNSARFGVISLQISANDAFNIYLGQSRRAAVGCVSPSDGTFYVFHNNNASRLVDFYPLELLSCSMTDRKFFFDRAAALWSHSWTKQLAASMQNLYELFTVRPGWPIAAYEPQYSGFDQFFQTFGLVAMVCPALLLMLGVLSPTRTASAPGLGLLGIPIALFFLTTAASSGQPRYLLPYYFTFAPLAVGCWRDVIVHRTLSIRPRKALGLAFTAVAFLAILSLSSKSVGRDTRASLNPQSYNLGAISPPLSAKGKFWWFELSVAGEVNFLTPAAGVRVTTSGFTIFNRKLFTTETRNKVRIEIDGTLVERTRRLRAALYLRDTPAGWGSGVIRVSDGNVQKQADSPPNSATSYLTSDLKGSSWVSVPLGEPQATTAMEGEARTFVREIELEKLTGDSIQLFAVVVYDEG